MAKKIKLGDVDKGKGGSPGSDYTDRVARVYRVREGRYELYVRAAHGSNQGYLEEHARRERSYRANTIDDLMRIGISEVRDDSNLEEYCGREGVDALVAAIREACIESEDIRDATLEERGNGFPDVGDYVPGDDGELYLIVSTDGRIQTGQTGSGQSNWIRGLVKLADWSDVAGEDDVESGKPEAFSAIAIL